MRYLKLYESFNNNIEDILEDIKWIMIDMESELFGHERDYCFIYVIPNPPSKEDLESANGRLSDLGYSIVYVGKSIINLDVKTICWIVKSEFCKEHTLPMLPRKIDNHTISKIVDDKIADDKIIEDIQKKILLKMWKEEPVIDKTNLNILSLLNRNIIDISAFFREYLGEKVRPIIDSLIKKNKDYHILQGGYNFHIKIEEYSIESESVYIKCKILPSGIVDIIMGDGRRLDLKKASEDTDIGWEIREEITDCIENHFYTILYKKTGYSIEVEYHF